MPPEDLDSKLREIAASYRQLQVQLQQLLSEDSTVMALRREAKQALEIGDFAQVETLLHQAQARDLHAIQEQQASLKKRQLSAAATSAELGALKNIQLAYTAAATHYRQAAAVVPQDAVLTQAEYLNAEGVTWYVAGQYADAQPPMEHAFALREKVLGPEHPDVAQSLNNLAALYYAQGRYAEAEPRCQRALAIQEKVLGPEHPDVAQSLNNLATLYRAQGRYAEAEPRYERALAIQEKVLGPEHPNVALHLNNLAMLYYAQGRYAEAEPRYERALAIWEKVLSPEHPDVATVRENYAALLRATNRDAEAAGLEARWSAQQPPRAWLGIQMQRSTTPPGLLVEQVIAESPAAHAGIQPQDVIVRFNAQEVSDSETFLRLIGAAAIGTAVDVEIIHDGQRRTISVTLEQRPSPKP